MNAAARLVVKKRKYDSIASTLRDDFHWLLVRQRIDYKLCLFVFKCLHQLAPPYLSSMTVPLLVASTRRNLRSAGQGDLLVSRTKTVSFGHRSFAVAGPSTWNSLPTALKDPDSWTILQPANQLHASCSFAAIMYISAAVIIFIIRLARKQILLVS